MAQVRLSREATERGRSAPQFMVIDPEESPHLYATLVLFTNKRDAHRRDFGSDIPLHSGSTLDKWLEANYLQDLKFVEELNPITTYVITRAPGSPPPPASQYYVIPGMTVLDKEARLMEGSNEPTQLRFLDPSAGVDYLIRKCPIHGDGRWIYQHIKQESNAPTVITHSRLVRKFSTNTGTPLTCTQQS
jgi:hypothetical protein